MLPWAGSGGETIQQLWLPISLESAPLGLNDIGAPYWIGISIVEWWILDITK